MLGTDIDLGKVDTDTYVVAGIADHLCKWESCYQTTQLLGGDTKFVLSTSGHIAAMVNPPGNPKASFQTASSNPARRQGVAGVGEQGQGQLVGGLRRVARRAHRPGAQQADPARRRRRTSRSATLLAPMSMTAEPTDRRDPPTGATASAPSPCAASRHGSRCVRHAAGWSTSLRCCCATGSAPASRRSSRSSTRSTPTAAWCASTYPASAAARCRRSPTRSRRCRRG